jgi:aminoglycoside phosphotransferase (APT) family kinase protein
VALVPELGMVLWAYPNDPNLPGLGTLASRDAVAEVLQRDPVAFGLAADGALADLRLGVGKYVPGQRCGYRYRVRWRGRDGGEREHFLYGKAYQQGIGGPAYRILRQLASSDACTSGRLRIPMPYAYDAEREIVWQEMLPGKSFAKDASVLDLAAWAQPVAAALGAFHATRLELGPGLGLDQEREELAASVRKIAGGYPQHAARCAVLQQRLLDAVPGLEPVPPAPVHGSFKISHIFDAGGQVAFIDFDGAGLGDPTYDVGRFLAHLVVTGLNSKTDAAEIERAYERFGGAYGAAVPWGWPETRVRWYTAALLVSSQAYKCVKRMVPERVEAILAAAAAWFPAH